MITNAPLLIAAAGILLVVMVGLLVWLAVRMRDIERRYRNLTAGANGGSLESVLEDHVRQVRQATERVAELDDLTRQLERASRSHLQRFGFLRFNPFRDSGGDQSFALALADQDGNGVVVSGLHGRDATRVYAKSLSAWESIYPLTDEEREAIRKAKGETIISHV